MDKTSLELGATINVGNYNSIRVNVWAERPAEPNVAAAQDELYKELVEQLNDKLDKLLMDLHTKGWVKTDD